MVEALNHSNRLGEQVMKRVGIGLRRVLSAGAIGLLLGLWGGGAWAQGTGLTVGDSVQFGPRLQARIGLSTGHMGDGGHPSWQPHAGVLLGDYYFSRARFGSGDVSGGFRATSGLLLGQRSLALGTPALGGGKQQRWASPTGESPSEPWSAVPYLGVGWSGVSARGGWGLTADLGFAARPSGGGLRVNNAAALDDLLRELRLMPVLHIGVSYAF